MKFHEDRSFMKTAVIIFIPSLTFPVIHLVPFPSLSNLPYFPLSLLSPPSLPLPCASPSPASPPAYCSPLNLVPSHTFPSLPSTSNFLTPPPSQLFLIFFLPFIFSTQLFSSFLCNIILYVYPSNCVLPTRKYNLERYFNILS